LNLQLRVAVGKKEIICSRKKSYPRRFSVKDSVNEQKINRLFWLSLFLRDLSGLQSKTKKKQQVK